jgi:pyruvate formate-lyase/glycerol dehydratase family glycyl radical enzyme
MSAIEITPRVHALLDEVRNAPRTLCAERALLVTEYFRGPGADRRQPTVLAKAEALAHILGKKAARVYPGELLVGCFTSHRVGASLFPELHGVVVLEDLLRFDQRTVNPLKVGSRDRWRLLLTVLPFWLFRFLVWKAVPWKHLAGYLAGQLSPRYYLINESAGIAHLVPDHSKVLRLGTQGLREQIATRLAQVDPASEAASFLRATDIACGALETFAENYRGAALQQAALETDVARRTELERIAAVCGRVPKHPARSFHEALQAVLFTHIAVNIESLDNGISLGRLDQILWPYYQQDRAAGLIDRGSAFELLACFAAKLSEVVPGFSHRLTRLYSGLSNGQALIVGGQDRLGNDATNELTSLFLEVMARVPTRQPNYHARIHQHSPASYRTNIADALACGSTSPAVYNDEVIIPTLQQRNIPLADARDYSTVGCVEPAVGGRSFFSTDAALFDLGICLELALNQGRQFGHWRRGGAATPSAESCASIEAVFELFRLQVAHVCRSMLRDLQFIELGNARLHPTPLSSSLVDGCIESGRDLTQGGAVYNASGIQGVGAVEVGDSLAAIEMVVFEQRAASMADVVTACRHNFRNDPALRARLRSAPKFGNDHPLPDRWVGRVMEAFAEILRPQKNTRGGAYAAGFYSLTIHQVFGEHVGALPCGRLRGEPFSSGISPQNGADRKGPTAVFGSVAKLPLHLAENGVNLNLKLPPWLVAGKDGAMLLANLIAGAFTSGCMQAQVNVLDAKTLEEARNHPGRYPNLLVRVSGYSAYFDDLSPELKQEIIDRTSAVV